MSTVFSLPEQLTPDLSDGRAIARDWLMQGGDPKAREGSVPLWAKAMEAGFPEVVDELLAAGADPNMRDELGQGWLHWGVRTGQPVWLIQIGWRALDARWWQPDAQGHTPFHLLALDPGLAQAMGARWWAERRPWQRLCTPQDPVDWCAQQGHHLLARIWRNWRARP